MRLATGLSTALLWLFMVLRQSNHPYVFDRYSIAYFIILIGVTLFLVALNVAVLVWKDKAIKLLAANAIIFGVMLVLVELGGQVYGTFFRASKTLFLTPDRTLGWRMVPNLKWQREHDMSWFSSEYSHEVTNNKLGYRGPIYEKKRPPGTQRITIMGDSVVVGVQVPYQDTSAALLESSLNQQFSTQVMNFGLSDFSVGQVYLAWKNEASHYETDYLVYLLNHYDFNKTVEGYKTSVITWGAPPLWLRPTFALEGSRLKMTPAKDYEEFVRTIDEYVASNNGSRTLKTERKWFLPNFIKPMIENMYFKPLMRMQAQKQNLMLGDTTPVENKVVDVNMKIIEKLARSARSKGAQLLVVDMIEFYNKNTVEISQRVEAHSKKHRYRYMKLTPALEKSIDAGQPVTWKQDFHFNQLGHKIFAEELEKWILNERRK